MGREEKAREGEKWWMICSEGEAVIPVYMKGVQQAVEGEDVKWGEGGSGMVSVSV